MPCDMRPGRRSRSHRCRPTWHRSRCRRLRQCCYCLAQTPCWQDPDRTAAAAGCCRQQGSGWSQVRACRKAEHCRMTYLQRCPRLLTMNVAEGRQLAAMHADACRGHCAGRRCQEGRCLQTASRRCAETAAAAPRRRRAPAAAASRCAVPLPACGLRLACRWRCQSPVRCAGCCWSQLSARCRDPVHRASSVGATENVAGRGGASLPTQMIHCLLICYIIQSVCLASSGT